MNAVALFGDAVCLVGMLVAVVALAMTPAVRPEVGVYTKVVKAAFIAVWAIYAYVAAASLIETIVPGFDTELYEGYLEMLAPVLVLAGFYGAYTARQYGDLKRAESALASSHAFMVDMVDAAPAGILFLDPSGAIAFANTSAKEVLDLVEDDRGWFAAPWKAQYGPTEQFEELLDGQSHSGVPVTIEWPDGWKVGLDVSTQVTRDTRGRTGGYVLTFERPGLTARAAEAR